MVRRLGLSGRVHEPPPGYGDIEPALLDWLQTDPIHRRQAEEWLAHPSYDPDDSSGRKPSVEWAERERLLRRPIEEALGIMRSGGHVVGYVVNRKPSSRLRRLLESRKR